MTPSVVGEIANARLLQPDWYKNLSDVQLAAYLRYQFIWQKEHAIDWDSPAHLRLRKNWDGGTNNFGTQFKSRWKEAALIVKENDAAPGMWVHSQFSPAANLLLNPVTQSLPEIQPANLYSKKAPAVYAKYVRTLPERLLQQYNIAGITLQTRIAALAGTKLSPAEQEMYALGDEGYVTATPFFRHVFAVAADCADALETYLWAAAMDYEANQIGYELADEQRRADKSHADDIEWITEPLLHAVVAIREHWENYHGD